MTVGGWFDAEDLKAFTYLQNHRKNQSESQNTIVMGPFFLTVVGLTKWGNIFITRFILETALLLFIKKYRNNFFNII